jgi:hypothetical protein
VPVIAEESKVLREQIGYEHRYIPWLHVCARYTHHVHTNRREHRPVGSLHVARHVEIRRDQPELPGDTDQQACAVNADAWRTASVLKGSAYTRSGNPHDVGSRNHLV